MRSPTTTSPVAMPTRICGVYPDLTVSLPTSATRASPVRTARSASSSCACGYPKYVSKPSPIYLATKPPERVIVSAQHRWYALIISRVSSGSSRVDSAVDPTKSQNITVSWRRSGLGIGCCAEAAVGAAASEPAVGAARLAPHSEQNFDPARFWAPHATHRNGTAAPQSLQNLLPSGTSALQLGHSIARSLDLFPRAQRARPAREACDGQFHRHCPLQKPPESQLRTARRPRRSPTPPAHCLRLSWRSGRDVRLLHHRGCSAAASKFRRVPSSSAPIKRQKPATSAAKNATSLRSVSMALVKASQSRPLNELGVAYLDLRFGTPKK